MLRCVPPRTFGCAELKNVLSGALYLLCLLVMLTFLWLAATDKGRQRAG